MAIVTERYEEAGDWYGLRQEYRKRNLERVRREFGLPAPEIVNGRAIYRDAEGKERSWFQSKRPEATIEQVEEFWGGNPVIEPLKVSEDGVPIEAELRDLARDSDALVMAETVDFGAAVLVDLQIDNIHDDEWVDQAFQEYVKNQESR